MLIPSKQKQWNPEVPVGQFELPDLKIPESPKLIIFQTYLIAKMLLKFDIIIDPFNSSFFYLILNKIQYNIFAISDYDISYLLF